MQGYKQRILPRPSHSSKKVSYLPPTNTTFVAKSTLSLLTTKKVNETFYAQKDSKHQETMKVLTGVLLTLLPVLSLARSIPKKGEKGYVVPTGFMHKCNNHTELSYPSQKMLLDAVEKNRLPRLLPRPQRLQTAIRLGPSLPRRRCLQRRQTTHGI